MNKLLPIVWVLITILAISCSNSKKTVYFMNQGNAEMIASNLGPRQVIEVGDLLSITMTSKSTKASGTPISTTTNTGYTAASYTGAGSQVGGYLVDADGYIKYPELGKVKAVDLTANELEEKITAALLTGKLELEPIVTVRNLNFKVTVLGEVARPTVINVPNAKISLLEALGLAGDLTIYGRRDNVLIIREEKGKKVTIRINLNSTELFNSPYYYLKASDVIYVEPNNAKMASASKAKEWLPIIFSGLSLTIITLDILTRSR